MQRFPAKVFVDIMWQTGDKQQWAAVKATNISDTGMAIKIAQPLPCASLVYISAKKLGLAGAARVRHCKPKGFGYIVGLEFKGCLAKVG